MQLPVAIVHNYYSGNGHIKCIGKENTGKFIAMIMYRNVERDNELVATFPSANNYCCTCSAYNHLDYHHSLLHSVKLAYLKFATVEAAK